MDPVDPDPHLCTSVVTPAVDTTAVTTPSSKEKIDGHTPKSATKTSNAGRKIDKLWIRIIF